MFGNPVISFVVSIRPSVTGAELQVALVDLFNYVDFGKIRFILRATLLKGLN